MVPGEAGGAAAPEQPPAPAPPRWRIGVLAGLTAIMCCVGPTVLAALGIVSAATASTWGNDLYDGYAWWFRLAGVAVLAGLVAYSLHRQRSCSLAGVRRVRGRLVALAAVAATTYGLLYAFTSWLERFA
ncbi:MAG: hypothetical protein H0X00_13175 [Sporichthya sp.]|nr:hypothetical protein [Sporichthya sp.]